MSALAMSGSTEDTDCIGPSLPLSGQYKGLRGGYQFQAVCAKRQKARFGSQARLALHDDNLIGNASVEEGPGCGGAALDQKARDAFGREPHKREPDVEVSAGRRSHIEKPDARLASKRAALRGIAA